MGEQSWPQPSHPLTNTTFGFVHTINQSSKGHKLFSYLFFIQKEWTHISIRSITDTHVHSPLVSEEMNTEIMLWDYFCHFLLCSPCLTESDDDCWVTAFLRTWAAANLSPAHRPSTATWKSSATLRQEALFRAAVLQEEQESTPSSSLGQKSGRSSFCLHSFVEWKSSISSSSCFSELLPLPTLQLWRMLVPVRAASHGRPVRAWQENNYNVCSVMEEGPWKRKKFWSE